MKLRDERERERNREQNMNEEKNRKFSLIFFFVFGEICKLYIFRNLKSFCTFNCSIVNAIFQQNWIWFFSFSCLFFYNFFFFVLYLFSVHNIFSISCRKFRIEYNDKWYRFPLFKPTSFAEMMDHSLNSYYRWEMIYNKEQMK